MPMKLIYVEILNNYVEPNDKLYITTTWQNTEDAPDFSAEISADIVFLGNHRREESQNRNFRFSWTPFPETDRWKKGEVWTSTGVWIVPNTWGATFSVSISLTDENGMSVSFIGRDGNIVYRQYIDNIDIGWGWGRKKLLEQRKKLCCNINKSDDIKTENTRLKLLSIGNYILSAEYPCICGHGGEQWKAIEPCVTVRRISDSRLFKMIGEKGITYGLESSEGQLSYIVYCEHASFKIKCVLRGESLSFIIADVKETDGYELISVDIPSLVQMSGDDTELVNYFGGGRIVTLGDTLMQSYRVPYDACNAFSVSSERGAFCLLANDVDDILQVSVVKQGDSPKTAVLGAKLVAHIAAQKAGMRSIPVASRPLELHYSEKDDWMMSARLLRSKLPDNLPHVYENTIMYKMLLDASGQYNPDRPETYSPIYTLAEAREKILKIHSIYPSLKQIVYLVGWQPGGHDFEYPYPHRFPFNPSCGTREEFIALRDELRPYGIQLSFHDNFDDAYLSDTYELNPDIVARDSVGQFCKGWLWAGGMSYILSPKSYLKSEDFVERLNSLVYDYKINDTIHLDVMSSEIRRYNFDQDDMSSAQENIDAKIGIIKEFNKKGIEVTSETLTMPFVGNIGYAQGTRYKFDGDGLFYGDKLVPLTTVALHGAMPYVIASGGDKTSLLQSIACGAACSLHFEKDFESLKMLRSMYIVTVPMNRIAFKKVINAIVDGSYWRLEYEDDCSVEVDFETQSYRIVIGGEIVSENFTTFISVNDNTYILFSMNKGKQEVTLPADWQRAAVGIKDSGKEDKQDISVNHKISFCAEADTVYTVRRV